MVPESNESDYFREFVTTIIDLLTPFTGTVSLFVTLAGAGAVEVAVEGAVGGEMGGTMGGAVGGVVGGVVGGLMRVSRY